MSQPAASDNPTSPERDTPVALDGEPDGYARLVATDPDDENWLEIAKAAVADGSALRMASTTEDVRRLLAELRSEQ